MNLTVCSTLCKECPFSKESPKGWLGSHSLKDILKTHENEELFSCHLARKTNMTIENIESGEIKICRGYIASATKSGVIFSDSTQNGSELKRLQDKIIKEQKDEEAIILSRDEFKLHHDPYNTSARLSISQEEIRRRQGYKSAIIEE